MGVTFLLPFWTMSGDATRPEPPRDALRWRVQTTTLGLDWVPWRGDLYLPTRWRSRVDGEHLPFRAELTLVAESEDVRCEAISFSAREGGEAITPRGLRKMPTGALVEVAVTSATQRAEHKADELVIRFAGPGKGNQWDDGELLDMRPARERGSAPHLRDVAVVYLGAERSPTLAVQDHFGPIGYSTAAHWVAKARRRGFIPPATRGRGSAGKEQR
jgi:hypothetical protein